MTTRANHLPALDGLRACAIMLVLARHALRPFDSAPLITVGGYDPFSIFLNGWLGVDLFFALSGYLVGRRILLDHAAACFSWAEYARGRLLRIAPAYLCVVVLAVAFFALGGLRDPASLFTSITSHLLFMQDVLGSDLVTPLWSLGVEAKFYLAAPLLIALALRGGGKWLVALALMPLCARAALWANADHALTYEAFFATFRSPIYACWDGLALGVLAAWALHRPRATIDARAPRTAFWCGAGLFAALLLTPAWFAAIDWFDALFLQAFAGLGAALMVFGAAAGAGPQRLLSIAPLRWLARHAYALYLTHWAAIAPALLLARVTGAEGLALLAVFTPIYLGFSFASAMALHRLVEAPFLRAGAASAGLKRIEHSIA